MQFIDSLNNRSGSTCELCSVSDNLNAYCLDADQKESLNNSVLLCQTCNDSLTNPSAHTHHWHCLSGAIWNEADSVKALSYRILNQLPTETWAQDLKEQIFLDEEFITLANKGMVQIETNDSAPTMDSNGTRLAEGDSVTLIKDLDVKGAGFTAKRGTLVKNISLTNNPLHIEGRVNGVQIVLVSAFLKKVQT